ncbi:hypothetical protein QTP70_029272 [Hemibagrus guttatus]|uniref:Uncharacterized protein n=1 Tax=Hemibagrus guttatus TaxID=175788 RepID=A0AAE0QL52_9TELE|nr:hypothetical protein QTP70_029272 [Hemibagrus guttatus]
MDLRIWVRKLVHVEVVQHKEEHQAYLPHQTKGTIAPSTHQVPHAVPVVDNGLVINIVPVVDKVPVVNIVPVVNPAAEVPAPTQAQAPSTPIASLSEVQQEKDTTEETSATSPETSEHKICDGCEKHLHVIEKSYKLKLLSAQLKVKKSEKELSDKATEKSNHFTDCTEGHEKDKKTRIFIKDHQLDVKLCPDHRHENGA